LPLPPSSSVCIITIGTDSDATALLPASGRAMTNNRTIRLTTVVAPTIGPVVSAPPVLRASDHTIDYTCGNCGALLLHAEEDQIHNLTIRFVLPFDAPNSGSFHALK
jgi:hypothetical protein